MIKYVATKIFKKDFSRFLLSGGFNTIVTYGAYLLLLKYFSYNTSYTMAYVGGIILAYVLNRFFVFGSHKGIKSVVLFPLVYLAQYLVSLIVLWAWVEKLGLDERAAPLLAIAITVPMTFILTKLLFSEHRTHKDPS
ncbi:GtrA family protein [Pseudomonas sp. 1912-s]|uniref:GtrA family protein n=1 Tax=Pseudomonas sp. 1912-s TaxID=3033802 RepID=UPI0023DEA0F5|nr:GtrA family protein [Pseudomonas sp. 1912-s]MDF3197209.1 GtrA family protein [Pseudomonas sp. 1912-s]